MTEIVVNVLNGAVSSVFASDGVAVRVNYFDGPGSDANCEFMEGALERSDFKAQDVEHNKWLP